MGNIWARIKSLHWVKTLGLVMSAVLLAVMAGRASSRASAAKRKDERAEELINSQISADIQKAKKLVDAAHKDKDKAAAAHKRMEEQLSKLGDADEDLDSIMGRFNDRSVRHQSTD